MEYTVIVQSWPDDPRTIRPQHRPMYRGPDLEFARSIAAHYQRPIDNISAQIIETATEADNVGWFGERVIT